LGFPLSKSKEGIAVFNVESKLGCGGIFGRSAGVSIKILNSFVNKYNKILIKLSSGDEYLINANCMATLGVVSNSDFWSRDLKKAGVKRYYGFRSFVRGVAMNPVDHAHGVEHVVVNFLKRRGLLTKGVKTRKLPISELMLFLNVVLDELIILKKLNYIKKWN
jgi:large subunit ribosomal protein L2